MGYQVSWIVEQRLLRVEMEGTIDMDQLSTMQKEMFRYLDEGQAPVHVLADITNVTSYPSVFNLAKAASVRYEKAGWALIVGSNATVQFVASTLMNLLGVRFRLVSTVDEAQAFLRKQDETIPL